MGLAGSSVLMLLLYNSSSFTHPALCDVLFFLCPLEELFCTSVWPQTHYGMHSLKIQFQGTCDITNPLLNKTFH